MFFWTPAHFWALALKYRDDYAAAGIPMLPVVRGIEETTRQIAGVRDGHGGGHVRHDAHRRGRPVLRRCRCSCSACCSWSGRSRSCATPTPQAAIQFFVWSNVYLMLVFVAVAVDALIR